MSYLLDTSSLLPLIRSSNEEKKLSVLRDAKILDLTYYEIGNTLWKASEKNKTLSREETDLLIPTLTRVIRRLDRLELDLEDEQEEDKVGAERGRRAGFAGVLDIARKEGLTFYDSSYVYVAKARGMTLLTEDARLARAAKKYVKTKSLDEVLG